MGADNRRVNHGIFLVTLIRQVPKYRSHTPVFDQGLHRV